MLEQLAAAGLRRCIAALQAFVDLREARLGVAQPERTEEPFQREGFLLAEELGEKPMTGGPAFVTFGGTLLENGPPVHQRKRLAEMVVDHSIEHATIELQARLLAKALTGETEQYVPFLTR